MEPRDLSEVLSLLGFLVLFAGAGFAGYVVGRRRDASMRDAGLGRPRRRRGMKSAVQ